ncbi:MAG TPA: hypothetical protein VGQ36_02355 [Thermoanaerobaculia bacterium]|jgi:hypothetical protein|nr:hypothetical protein [Thermoanaerobaculia bacterium]
MRTFRLLAVLLVVHLAHASLAQQPAKRLITETDLFRFVWVADPRPLPSVQGCDGEGCGGGG